MKRYQNGRRCFAGISLTKLFALLLVCVCFSSPIFAQNGNESGGYSDPTGQESTDGNDTPGEHPDATHVPFDGGATILLASGALYGIRELKKSRQKNKEESEDSFTSN